MTILVTPDKRRLSIVVRSPLLSSPRTRRPLSVRRQIPFVSRCVISKGIGLLLLSQPVNLRVLYDTFRTSNAKMGKPIPILISRPGHRTLRLQECEFLPPNSPLTLWISCGLCGELFSVLFSSAHRRQCYPDPMYAQKFQVEVLIRGERRACPLEWLDQFSMRNFTNSADFDDTLPLADGRLQASFRPTPERFAEGLATRLTQPGKSEGQPVQVEVKLQIGRA